jgi:hypothetical protein
LHVAGPTTWLYKVSLFFYVNGTAELGVNTGNRSNGHAVSLTPGAKNIARESLVDPQKVLLPPLHIKMGLMKQFVKGIQRDGNCFKYLCSKFPGLSEAKLKDGIFVGPDIRKFYFG